MYLPVLYFNSADQVAFGNHALASSLTVSGHDTQFTITLNPKWHWPSSSTLFAEILQADWAKEGIKVSLVTQSIDTLYSVIGNPADSSKWAIAGGTLFGWLYIPDYEPSGDGLFNTGAGFDLGACSSPTMDHLIALTEAPGTPQQAKQRFLQYEAFAAQNLPVLYVPTPTIPIAVSTRIKGFASSWNSIESGVRWNDLSPK
jgi:peptide/nickel transport system substrate-binding protein